MRFCTYISWEEEEEAKGKGKWGERRGRRSSLFCFFHKEIPKAQSVALNMDERVWFGGGLEIKLNLSRGGEEEWI